MIQTTQMLSCHDTSKNINLYFLPCMQHQLCEQLDTKLLAILNNYLLNLNSLTVKNEKQELKSRLDTQQDQLVGSGATSNLVFSIESLLSLTGELKQTLLLNNVSNLNRQLLARQKTCSLQVDQTRAQLELMLVELKQVIQTLQASL